MLRVLRPESGSDDLYLWTYSLQSTNTRYAGEEEETVHGHSGTHSDIFQTDDITRVDLGNPVFRQENGENEILISVLNRGVEELHLGLKV